MKRLQMQGFEDETVTDERVGRSGHGPASKTSTTPIKFSANAWRTVVGDFCSAIVLGFHADFMPNKNRLQRYAMRWRRI